MSRYFPHTAYAEDQPLSHTILAAHVLSRGYTAGAVVGLGALSVGGIYKRLRGVAKSAAPAQLLPKTSPASSTSAAAAATAASSTSRTTGLPRLLRFSGTASAVGLGLMAVALAGRMRGREDIEWRDRAWRLMENRGQLETDDWTYGGAAAGLVALGAWRRAGAKGAAAAGWRAVAGAAGLGSVAGTVGYLVWRYGVHAGEFPEYAAVGEAAL